MNKRTENARVCFSCEKNQNTKRRAHWIDGVKTNLVKEDKVTNTNDISAGNEEKLSKKAQDFLNNLRAKNKDLDFFVGNSTDDLQALSKSGCKEFTVIFSNAELEKISAQQKERIARSKEKAAEDKKNTERTGKRNPYETDKEPSVKRTTVEAATVEELLEQIRNVDWNTVSDVHSGDRINYEV